MKERFLLSATVGINAPKDSPFPINTNNFAEAANLLVELGYDAMELHLRSPEVIDASEVLGYCEKTSLSISTIGTGQAFGMEGLSLTSESKDIRRNAVQRIKEQIDLGRVLNCPVIIGSIHGNIGDRLYHEVDELMVESMIEIADHAEKTNVDVVIEAIDRFETDYLLTANEILELIDRIGSKKILVHLDTYHMNLEEQDWRKPILACKGKLGHMHVADNSRNYPGWGLIDFRPILEALSEIDYDRALTLECYPYPDSRTALVRGKKHLDGLMDALTCSHNY